MQRRDLSTAPSDVAVPSDLHTAASPGGTETLGDTETAGTTTAAVIRTPDQRVRVFVSSTLDELASERAAARAAITQLRLIPVQFESGARPHPPRDLYRAYLAQSAIFVGIYWQRYGWIAPGMTVSGLEDEYLLAQGKPKLIYLKAPAPARESRLQDLLDRIREENVACYRRFATAEELRELLQDDLAILLTEHFEQAQPGPVARASSAEAGDLPTGTVTFLITDIVGSTRLLQQLGAERYARVHADYSQFVRGACTAQGGRELYAAGDRFCMAFASASEAVAAAAAAQQGLVCHPWPEEGTVCVRMGLHTGAVHVVGTHYVGLDVQRAARIAAAAHGGQVVLSDATRALVEHALPESASLRDLGRYRLRDLQQPEHLFQLVVSAPPGLPSLPGLPGLPANFPPLNTLDTHPHNLPVEPTPLLGREREVAELSTLLRSSDVRLVTLTGPGGVGKTRLALQVAAELVDAVADGVWFVGLSRLTDPALVLPTVAQTLGLREAIATPLTEVLRAHLQAKQTLLLLDNCEQVAVAALQVADLLGWCPGLQVLATSRVALRLQGEHEYPVAPLALLPASGTSSAGPACAPEQIAGSPAVALFVARARAHRPDFQLTEANASAVMAICARLDGLPLALELAAARLKLLPPQQLLARLERRLPLLTGGTRDVEARQQTMRNTLVWSENLLSSDEQRFFRRLAVFVGGFTLEAAEAVCAQPKGAEPLGIDVLDGLGVLVDHSLVQPWTADGNKDRDGDGGMGTDVRFRWLYVVREYAQERLEASDEVAAVHAAHAAYYLALAEQSTPELRSAGQQAEEWLQRMGREYDNVRAALSWLRDRGEVTLGLRVAVAIGDFWIAHSRFSEGRGWLESLLAMTPSMMPSIMQSMRAPMAPQAEVVSPEAGVPAVVQTQARALLGTLAFLLGDDDTAAVQLEAGLALGRALGDQRAVVYALGSLGDLARVRGEAERAAARYEEMARTARDSRGLPAGAAQMLAGEGLAAYERGEWSHAEALLEEELAVHLKRREQDSMGLCLWLLGVVALHQADPMRATERLRQAAVLARTLGNQDGLAYVLEGLAWASGAVGRGERAARLLGAAAARREALGQVRWPHFREEVETEVATVREALGEVRWTAAYAVGRALSFDKAAAEALEDSGYAKPSE